MYNRNWIIFLEQPMGVCFSVQCLYFSLTRGLNWAPFFCWILISEIDMATQCVSIVIAVFFFASYLFSPLFADPLLHSSILSLKVISQMTENKILELLSISTNLSYASANLMLLHLRYLLLGQIIFCSAGLSNGWVVLSDVALLFSALIVNSIL